MRMNRSTSAHAMRVREKQRPSLGGKVQQQLVEQPAGAFVDAQHALEIEDEVFGRPEAFDHVADHDFGRRERRDIPAIAGRRCADRLRAATPFFLLGADRLELKSAPVTCSG
jgi:hypothetical protein